MKKTRGDDRRIGRDYLRDWFDFDRLISATAPFMHEGTSLGTVIIRSTRSVGRDKDPKSDDPKDKGEPAYALTADDETERFWTRQGSAPHTSTMLVVVPGTQKGEKETGVDTALVVHLFETMDQWDTAMLFTADSDFVPAVWSLRRRGKRVLCSFASQSDEDAHRPLVQASQSFIPWDLDFLRTDFAMFHFLTAVYPSFSETPAGKMFKLYVTPQHRLSRYGAIVLTAKDGTTRDVHIVVSGPGLGFVQVMVGVQRNHQRWLQAQPGS